MCTCVVKMLAVIVSNDILLDSKLVYAPYANQMRNFDFTKGGSPSAESKCSSL
jgi:hypothetical protein